MSLIDSATNAVTSAATAVASGPASALSSVGNTISGVISATSDFLKSFGGSQLPLPNVLSGYTTYNYVLSLGVLTDTDLNNPDSTYMANKPIDLICKTANAEPYNRVATAYGKFDFFMDNLNLIHSIGFEKNNNTNVMSMTFQITEPYSMGMFTIALQTAAFKNGWQNYKDACYLLKIEFRGNNSTGFNAIPNTTRYIPIQILNLDMRVNEKGAVYNVRAIPYNHQALSTRTANFKSDTTIKGATVQELLQTGEKSLQAVLNQREQQIKEDGAVVVPDEYVILFPTDIASSAAPATTGKETKDSATTSTAQTGPGASGGSGALFEKLGLTKSKINKTQVQPDGACNALGKASMGFSLDKKGDPVFGSETKVWDPKNKVWTRGKNATNIKEGEFKFTQDTDVINAINQVLLNSDYPTKTLDTNAVTKEGMRDWWKIDTQVYSLSSDANASTTGKKPRLIVYRVIPYTVSVDRTNPPNTPPPGVPALKKQAVKEYNYLYTGKNSEILKFDIEFKLSFAVLMAADGLKRSQDVKTSANSGLSEPKKSSLDAQPDGSSVAALAGVVPTTTSPTLLRTSSDGKGGGGPDTSATRAARVFHDAITKGSDMMRLNMEIWGDPYYIAQSGTGNYTSKATSYQNLNSDGTINYQNGEVYINVNFRTPIDVNQATGLYTFSGGASAPVVQYSGLYRIMRVNSVFNNGQFKQTLVGSRMLQQENPIPATQSKVFSTTASKPDAKDPYGYGDG
jgi:hypothetical protein